MKPSRPGHRFLLSTTIALVGGVIISIATLLEWRGGQWVNQPSGRGIAAFTVVWALIASLVSGAIASFPSWLVERTASDAGRTSRGVLARAILARSLALLLVGLGLVTLHGGAVSLLFVLVATGWLAATATIDYLALARHW